MSNEQEWSGETFPVPEHRGIIQDYERRAIDKFRKSGAQ